MRFIGPLAAAIVVLGACDLLGLSEPEIAAHHRLIYPRQHVPDQVTMRVGETVGWWSQHSSPNPRPDYVLGEQWFVIPWHGIVGEAWGEAAWNPHVEAIGYNITGGQVVDCWEPPQPVEITVVGFDDEWHRRNGNRYEKGDTIVEFLSVPCDPWLTLGLEVVETDWEQPMPVVNHIGFSSVPETPTCMTGSVCVTTSAFVSMTHDPGGGLTHIGRYRTRRCDAPGSYWYATTKGREESAWHPHMRDTTWIECR